MNHSTDDTNYEKEQMKNIKIKTNNLFESKFNEMVENRRKFKRNFTNDELSCENISQNQCEELRNMDFSNKPNELFLEVRSLEERYQYEITSVEEELNEKIEKSKEDDKKRFNKVLKNREKEIQHKIEQIKEAIEENLQTLETQENMMIGQIEMIYKLHKEDFVEDVFKILGFDFKSTSSTKKI